MPNNTSKAIPKQKIVLLVPDGIGVRNYLYSDVLKHLGKFEVILLHRLPDAIIDTVQSIHPNAFTPVYLPDLPETRWNDLLRKICMFCRLQTNARILNNASIKSNWFFFSTLKGYRKWYYRFLNLLGATFSILPGVPNILENWLASNMRRSASGKICRDILTSIHPTLIVCTHQRSIEAGYVMEVATQLQIKTATVIFSWDNLPKSRMTFKANYYFVWSNYMKTELQKLYTNIADQQVLITGTPQFDNYYKESIAWSREHFEANFGLSKNQPAICFAGNEPNFPSDYLYLRDLLEEIQSGSFPIQPLVLVRPSPNDYTGRLEAVASKFPGIARIALPVWNRIGDRDWETNFPTPEDNIVLTNLVKHCACVVNIGSTMSLDFAHGNKPAINIAYNHPDCTSFDLEYGYQQQHIKTMDGLDAAFFLRSRADIAGTITTVLETPQKIATDRLVWKKVVTNDIEDAGAQVAKAISQLLA